MCSIPLAGKHDAAVYFTATALLPARARGAHCISDWSHDRERQGYPASRPARPQQRARRFRRCQRHLVPSCLRSVARADEPGQL